MKKGASFFSFAEDVNLSEAMDQMKKAGYNGVELVLGGTGELTMDTTDQQLQRIAAMAGDYGLEIPSVGTWLLWANNVVSPDEKERETCRDIMRKQLDSAAAFGADTILIVPGYCGTEFAQDKPLVRYDDAYQRARDSIAIRVRHTDPACAVDGDCFELLAAHHRAKSPVAACRRTRSMDGGHSAEPFACRPDHH